MMINLLQGVCQQQAQADANGEQVGRDDARWHTPFFT
jgi:hypothetical protein